MKCFTVGTYQIFFLLLWFTRWILIQCYFLRAMLTHLMNQCCSYFRGWLRYFFTLLMFLAWMLRYFPRSALGFEVAFPILFPFSSGKIERTCLLSLTYSHKKILLLNLFELSGFYQLVWACICLFVLNWFWILCINYCKKQ